MNNAMGNLIDFLLTRQKIIILCLLVTVLFGVGTYNGMSKELRPDINMPIIFLTTSLDGISAIDSERILVRPIESHLISIEGIKEMRSTSRDNYASVVLEFDVNFDSHKALQDVRNKIDDIRGDLPSDATPLSVTEVNTNLFPVLNIALLGDSISDRELYDAADKLKDEIESLTDVIEAKIVGKREEVVDILISPSEIEKYQINISDIVNIVNGNNAMIPAGKIIKENGQFSIEVNGLVENVFDLLKMPVLVSGERVVLFEDIAEIKRTFKEPESIARINGKRAVVLEVSKRSNAGALSVIEKVKNIVNAQKDYINKNIEIFFSQDNSISINENLNNLENNIIFAMLLIFIVIYLFMGIRTAIIVSMSLPISFIIGIVIIAISGFTLNIVVLFALILSVGMLVDAAIIITESADQNMLTGKNKIEAYGISVRKMASPTISSVATTIIVFVPLMFWPGIAGKFMFYLPTTLSATLFGSLVSSMIFLPTIGSIFGGVSKKSKDSINVAMAIDRGDMSKLDKFRNTYYELLKIVLRYPLMSLLIAVFFSFSIVVLYFVIGVGVEFFPNVEPDNLFVNVNGIGNFSIYEKDKIMREVEERIVGIANEFDAFYTRVGATGITDDPANTIGSIQIKLKDWQLRRKYNFIMSDIVKNTSDIKGFDIEVLKESNSPSGTKPIKVQLLSQNGDELRMYAKKLLSVMRSDKELFNIEDNIDKNITSWSVVIDKEKAALFGLNNAIIGSMVRMITTGLKITEYRPSDTKEEIDIRIRFPEKNRTIDQIRHLRISTSKGVVPISNFIQIKPSNKISSIYRSNRAKSITIQSDIAYTTNVEKKIGELYQWVDNNKNLDVKVHFKGDYEDQNESKSFLMKAFFFAILGIFMILLFQFNSILHSLIIMTAIFFSTLGVFFGLLVTFRPFGIVMSGIGVVTLAGVVVNNNILLIDKYIINIRGGYDVVDAILHAAVSRVRAILLTAGTTVLGLIPMVFGITIDFINFDIMFNAPSSQWWKQLSSSIAGGLTFATVITLFLTPCMVLLVSRYTNK